MSIRMIGQQIASLRKERGIKQDELASYVGVSAQAVSKWENGGVPDTELLPKIADFFEVSIDSLFGRTITDYSDLQSALTKKIIETPNEQRFKLALNYCWDIERALCGDFPKDGGIEDYESELAENEQRHSSVINNYGFTFMGIANIQQYFLLVPEPQNIEAAYLNGVDYTTFFKDFSDTDVFNTCVMLYKRESNAFFTENFISKNMNIDIEKTKYTIETLEKYHLLYKTQIEMDDELQTVYSFKPTPTFIALLIFTKEMIKKPCAFSYYWAGRNKPYLK